MSRIATRFAELAQQRRKGLITFITAGDPAPAATVPLLHAMVAGGADIIEVGVPFSDPMAEGPVIQRASERALRHHVSLHDVLAMVAEFRRTDTRTPVVLMGYLNPIEHMGYRAFAAAAQQAGADGVITVDLPPEEGAEYIAALRAARLDPVFLLAPTSTPARIRQIGALASGFVYYVSLKGVTGASTFDLQSVAGSVAAIRRDIHQPLAVGFGIKTPQVAAQAAALADAVVIGSAVVSIIEQCGADSGRAITEVTDYLTAIRQAIDAA
ncbi:MAG: tryptophan synthase subunit alpha [Gammaproteobacteria bacterium]|nr:tryptophan synthase subunit alpha [Gammaproteobacteria bacterium]